MAPRPKGFESDLANIIAKAIAKASKGVAEVAPEIAKTTKEVAPTVRSVAAAAVESSSVAGKLVELRAAKAAGSLSDAKYLDGLLDIRASKGALTKEERRTINIAQNKALQDSKKTGGALADERMQANIDAKKIKSDKSKDEMKKYADIKFTGKERYDIAAKALRDEFDITMSIVDFGPKRGKGLIEKYELEGNNIVDAAVTEFTAARKAGMKVTSPEYGELVRNAKQKLAKWTNDGKQAAKAGESRSKGLETRLGNLSKMTDQEVIDAGVQRSLWDDDISMAEIRRVRQMNQNEFAVWRSENLRDPKKVSKLTGKPFPTGSGGDKPLPVSKASAELMEMKLAKLAKKAGLSLEDYKKVKAAEKAQQMRVKDKMNVPDVDTQDVLREGKSSFKVVAKDKEGKVIVDDKNKELLVEATAKQRAASIKRTDALRKRDAKVAKQNQKVNARYDKVVAPKVEKPVSQSALSRYGRQIDSQLAEYRALNAKLMPAIDKLSDDMIKMGGEVADGPLHQKQNKLLKEFYAQHDAINSKYKVLKSSKK